MTSEILHLKNINLHLGKESDSTQILNNLSFNIFPSELVALIGESGSGKSMTAKLILRLSESLPGYKVDGDIHFNTQQSKVDILSSDLTRIRSLRSEEIGIVFQQSKTVFNPSKRIGEQIKEKLLVSDPQTSKSKLDEQVLNLLQESGLENAERYAASFPHQLSGGQIQRCLIALALANDPTVLIADEPASALDAHLKKDILNLLTQLKEDRGLSILLISHDLELVEAYSDRILILKDGNVVEQGDPLTIFNQPRHNYTKALMACKPPEDMKVKRLPVVEDFIQNPSLSINEFYQAQSITNVEIENRNLNLKNAKEILSLSGISKTYYKTNYIFKQDVDRIQPLKEFDLMLRQGEIVGLVGKSGSGKSTLARIASLLEKPEEGDVRYEGESVYKLSENTFEEKRRRIQLIFQDPMNSMPPHLDINQLFKELIKQNDWKERAIEALEEVGLDQSYLNKIPRTLSGGERQRILIARALIVNPQVLICDEILSALDVSSQARVLNLLKSLNEKLGLSILFISHDRNLVEYISDRIYSLD